ncbi:MAG: universal stress protein [Maribacter dokdonensis]|jgi:nucleotide-binding universal stress UspA family protein|uniref:Nucleotide-binding universal stress protein, UspA family n=1 Tax=Maribacter dokdonensis TaxID=320912 RepID=A0A1H4TXW4_9FLAO|nr:MULTISPECIES: universal stress protein [Maribacter]HAF76259.1 universal stress protein [Maribacter sp.]KSA12066.1 Universal stress protein [Maribacter dokdonensis DSW-8]MDP2524958.1 universal stress protein [Maribacter dokdonensis]PHN92700.1 universal stress protein [Maribacter sp. 6B07]CAG2533759.1 Nucleotide-binding universal stress protein [Maribacter dokdonensis]|tara:strand:- start:18383 stop:19204 length:822 start_codon:yes stop_codon:yes gene_type:complete
MKKIIVLTDFSEPSENALKAAADLAKKHDVELFVVHMLELNQAILTSPDGMYIEQTVFLVKLAEKNLEEFLQKPYLDGIKVTPVIKHYKVYSELDAIAEEHNADLIVMGSNGSSGFEEIFIGSNAEKVVRNATVPVLVIKGEVNGLSIDRFVFACDFNDDNLPAFQKAREFADMINAKMEVVFINTPNDAFMSNRDAYQKINKFLTKANAAVQVEIYNDYSVEQGILNYGNTILADAIAMPTHGRKGISHLFNGSIGEDVVNHARIPVITFKI